MAGQAYRPPYRPAPELVRQIDYEAHGKIRFNPERAIYGPGSGGTHSAYPATFFPLGRSFGTAAKMHALQPSAARELHYSPAYFDMPPHSVALQLLTDSGVAGSPLQTSTKHS